MDGLSLLCNLHADGPLALRRLRAAGVRDLDALASAPEATLIECLRSTAGHARRFVQEGRQLALRLAESPLEPEPTAEQGGFFPPPAPPERAEAEAPVRTWRAQPWVRAVHGAGAHPLEPGVLSGLDETICERLGAQGVRTLEALHERASLALARSTGLPFAKLLDLAGQARLALEVRESRPREIVPESPRHAPALAGRSVARTGASVPIPSARFTHHTDPGSSGPFG
jgi:hypothetical protein